jgi:hypothetical protein
LLAKAEKDDDFVAVEHDRSMVGQAADRELSLRKLLQIETIQFGHAVEASPHPHRIYPRHRATITRLGPHSAAEQAENGTVALRICHKHGCLGALTHGPRKRWACILDHNITV